MAGAMQRLTADWSLLRAGERVCVALSGGADSVALLLALLDSNAAGPQNKSPLGVVVSAAHVNHGLRGAESDGDESFVRELCGRLGVPLRVFRVDTPARQAAEAEGIEEAARTLRYQALWGLMAAGEVDAVATAHTLDDQAETVAMKLLRGAWTEGLGGISPVLKADQAQKTQGQGRVVRPMLAVRRAEVEEFLRARGVLWREDSSNADLGFMRNRVRRQLMPLLRGFNPGVDSLLARTAEIARDEEAFWQAELARVLPQILLPGKPVRGGGRAVATAIGEAVWAVEIERLKAMPAALRRRVVRAIGRKLEASLSSEETAKVLALGGFGGHAGVTGKIGSRLELRAGFRVERSARELRFWRDGDFGG